MPTFIELSCKDGGSVSVNVNRIACFEEVQSGGEDFCAITLDGLSLFVKETYSEVKSKLMVREAMD